MGEIELLFQSLFGRSLRAGFPLQFPIIALLRSKPRIRNREIFTATPNAIKIPSYFVY